MSGVTDVVVKEVNDSLRDLSPSLFLFFPKFSKRNLFRKGELNPFLLKLNFKGLAVNTSVAASTVLGECLRELVIFSLLESSSTMIITEDEAIGAFSEDSK